MARFRGKDGLLFALAFLFAGVAGAAEFNAADYRRLAQAGAATTAPLLVNGEFDEGGKGWNGLGGGCSVAPTGGINQTGALHYTRDDDSYRRVSQPVQLKPGQRYVFGAMVRTQNVTGEGAGLYVEGYENGKYAGGGYSANTTGSCDWVQVEHAFIPSPKHPEATYTLALYLRKGSRGEAWFDNVYLRESHPAWQLDPVYPTHGRLYDGEPLQLASRFEGFDPAARPESRFAIVIGDGAPKIVEAKQGLVGVWPDAAPAGPVAVRCTWFDPADKTILAEKEFTLLAGPKPEPSPNAAMIDHRHRLIVDGAPFMPLGLYTQQVTREDVDIIAAAPFNCILPYPSPNLRFPDSDKAGLDAIREVMDYCHAKGVKVIFSLKDIYDKYRSPWSEETDPDRFVALLVEALREHPALLAWYICDEAPLGKIPAIVERRRLVNRLDPFHPTYSVYYQVPDFEHYVPAQDVFGNDPYPINWPRDNHILGVDNSTAKAESLNTPLWAVPQIHHTGFYNGKWRDDPAEYFVDRREPTEKEMTTISLFEIMRRAKGFVLYSYFDLRWGPDTLQFERRWPEVARVAQTLQKLAPFALSDADAPEAKVAVKEGRVYARAFAKPDGDLRVVVVAPGPDAADAEIDLGEKTTGLLSEQGRTYEIRPGVYRFACLDTGYDILRP